MTQRLIMQQFVNLVDELLDLPTSSFPRPDMNGSVKLLIAVDLARDIDARILADGHIWERLVATGRYRRQAH